MILAVAGGIFYWCVRNVNLSHGQMYFLIVGILLSLVLKLKEEAYEELEQEYRKTRDDSKERNLLFTGKESQPD